MTESSEVCRSKLNALLTEVGHGPLDPSLITRFQDYLSLLLRWNARVNLTAIRDEDGILSRHFVESIACARALPAEIRTLLDFGSGAGFPGIPIALCRPEIAVTLAESQGRKAAFLQEAVRVLGISATVHAGRAEALTTPFDCVVLRAVDRMESAVQSAAQLVFSRRLPGINDDRCRHWQHSGRGGRSFSLGSERCVPGKWRQDTPPGSAYWITCLRSGAALVPRGTV
jgi:16S rRNA (guanine527-N7)-methyltransferase